MPDLSGCPLWGSLAKARPTKTRTQELMDGFRVAALAANKRQSTFPAILLLAFIIRLIGITSRPIWYDEAFAILFSAKGLAAMSTEHSLPRAQAQLTSILSDITPCSGCGCRSFAIPDRGTVAVNFCGRGNCCNFLQTGTRTVQ